MDIQTLTPTLFLMIPFAFDSAEKAVVPLNGSPNVSFILSSSAALSESPYQRQMRFGAVTCNTLELGIQIQCGWRCIMQMWNDYLYVYKCSLSNIKDMVINGMQVE